MYQQFPHGMLGMTIENFAEELNISVVLKNNCTVSILPLSYYDQHDILHKCEKMWSSNYVVLHTDNSDIKI